MSNVTQAETNFLRLANGDLREAFRLACSAYVRAWLAVSPGYVREKPSKPLAIDPKDPLADPVLLDKERFDGAP